MTNNFAASARSQPNEAPRRINSAQTIMTLVAGDGGIVDCGELLDWATARRREAIRRGGTVAKKIRRELRDAERLWLGGPRVSGRAATPFTAALADVIAAQRCSRVRVLPPVCVRSPRAEREGSGIVVSSVAA